ncbi:MAG: DUF5668 domain-containing protein [Candidatus Bipolaricaulota bacterium]
MTTDRRLRGAILPATFIVAGVLLLLNTLDLVNWSIWPRLARLWPILVIGFGAQLLWQHFRRT